MRSWLISSVYFIGFGCGGGKTVEVRNSDPEAWITSHSDQAEIFVGDVTLFIGSSSDANHQESDLLTNWYVDNRELCMGVFPTVDGTSICEAALEEGDEVLRLQVVDPFGATDFDEVSLNLIPYTNPDIAWESPLGGEQYYSDTPIAFRVDVTDERNASDELDVVWTSSQDGELDVARPDENGRIDDFLFLSPGTHIISLDVSNTGGKSSQHTESIIVRAPNQPPTCGISLPANGASIIAGAQVTFQGQVQDPDVEVSSLNTSWTSDQDGLLGSGVFDNNVLVLTTTNLSAAVHNISLSVEDELGLNCTDTIQLSVGTSPNVSIIQPTSAQVFSLGEDVELSAQIIDLEDASAQLVVEWSSDVAGLLDEDTPSNSGFSQYSINSLDAGAHVITCTATDPAGFSGSDDVEVYINTPPQAPTILLEPVAPSSIDDLVVTVTGAADIDNDPLTYSYQWYQDGNPSGFTTPTLSSVHTQVGEIWMVEVTASDGYTQGDVASASIQIGNTAPEITVPVISPSLAYNDDTLTCSAIATDIDQSVTVSYAWDVDGQIYTGASLDLSVLSVLPTAEITCIAQTIDDQLVVDTESSSVVLSNRAPQVSAHGIVPNIAYVGAELDCNASFVEPDGESLILSYVWTIGSTVLGTDALLTLQESDAQAGDVITCTATAADGYGESITSEAFASVQSVPTFDVQANITPSSGVYTGSSLVCSASASDPEDGHVPVLYTWSVGTTDIITGASYTVDLADVSVGDTLICTASATDLDQNTVISTAQVQIENSIPQINTVAITPVPLYNNDIVSCSASVFDMDETLLPSYSWSMGGQTLGTASSLSLDASIIAPLDVLICTVDVTDGSGVFVQASESITISNRAPQAPEIEITPSLPTIGQDDLLCSITNLSIDDDGDTVGYSYAWYLDGVLSSMFTSDTIPSTELMESQEWRCVVTPNDGIEDGAIASTTLNTPAACANTDCDLTVYFPDGTGMDFVEISAGTFDMGSPSGENGRESTKEVQHEVTLTTDFYMMTTEMNQAMFEVLMGYNPSFISCGVDCAIEKISWHEAAYFTNLLTDYANDYFGMSMDECYSCSGSGTTAYCTQSISPIYECTGFRLPTEAEWEYVSRSGSTGAFFNGGSIPSSMPGYLIANCDASLLLDNNVDVSSFAWHCGNAPTNSSGVKIPSPIAQKDPNNWGVYDMHGNVREWCNDWYAQNYGGTSGVIVDPIGGPQSTNRVIKGGSWDQDVRKMRSAYRSFAPPSNNLQTFGFRVVKRK